MTGTWPPLAATALAAALTYVCCIRPMRRHDACSPTPHEHTGQSIDEEIRRTREELDLLRAHSAAETDPAAAPSRRPETIRP
ncbi:hypothetical protein J7E96_19720 [Streptomyces sp. ISL-96]|uniref:hypothetical protein n=1 Tax=Streptomyces sp. ISL-96 TaxID=2819191 RepID=UPI001BE8C67C|nr:hypothetical protein [Streptomyces sp. ISL-96]MBT2490703.1 hypothetical protein [Streptomyces sp. ISL-96]